MAVKKIGYRLLLKIIDPSRPIKYDDAGRKYYPFKWIEVEEVNLGSMKNPAGGIFEFRYEPIILEGKR